MKSFLGILSWFLMFAVFVDDKGVVICHNGAHRTMAARMCNMLVFIKTKAIL